MQEFLDGRELPGHGIVIDSGARVSSRLGRKQHLKQRGLWMAIAWALLSWVGLAEATVPHEGSFSGEIGVYAARIDPGASSFTVLASDEHNPDVSFPLASSFKPVILYEVLSDIDAGTLAWGTRVDIPASDYSLDDGRIPRRATIRRLAKKMIRVSHNTSTDVLFKQVGIGAPEATLAAWGLSGMRIVMPTREFWLALSGLVPALFPENDLPAAAAFAASTRAAQSAVVEQVRAAGSGFDTDTIDAALADFYGFQNYNQSTTFDILDDVDNIATPREMAQFYWRLFFDNGFTEQTDKRLRGLMRRGDGAIDRRAIAVPLRYWGGKGGSDLGMGSVAGYGETRNGNHIIYAILGSHMVNENADLNIIDDLITWVFDTFDTP